MQVGNLFIWDDELSSCDELNIVIGDDRDDSRTHLIYLDKQVLR